jgi:hypothetical protein
MRTSGGAVTETPHQNEPLGTEETRITANQDQSRTTVDRLDLLASVAIPRPLKWADERGTFLGTCETAAGYQAWLLGLTLNAGSASIHGTALLAANAWGVIHMLSRPEPFVANTRRR